MTAAAEPTVLLVGNPNAGKTTLFNALTGATAKVGNYPGVTIERRVGRWRVGHRAFSVADLPGTYSLTARSREEQIAIDAVLGLGGARPDAIVVVADATALARSLYLAVQCAETGLPVVVGLTMMDEAESKGDVLDVEAIERVLGLRVVPLVATQRRGLEALAEALGEALERGSATSRAARAIDGCAEGAHAASFDAVEAAVREATALDDPRAGRAFATWALLSCGDDELEGVPPRIRAAVETARAEAPDAAALDAAIVAARYALVDEAVALAWQPSTKTRAVDRLDAVLLHPVSGLVVFALVMLAVFESLFAWSEPLVGFVEQGIGLVRDGVNATLPEGLLRELIADGIIAGVGNVVVFVPQIALLFLFIAFLEGSGYLARVAFVIDRLMAGVGLSGKAFVPMLSGFACAVPAVLATRTIESRRDRLVTMLALPFVSCSARLPVYVLVIATVFDPDAKVAGFLRVGSLVLLAMYVLSVVAAIVAAAVLRRTVLRGPRPTFVLELPPYRLPVARDVLRAVTQRVKDFLGEAGTMILALTIVMWAVLNFPRHDAVEARFDAQLAATEASASGDVDERVATVEEARASARLRGSVGGALGHALEPVLEPLGFDWRIGVGILGAFAAREVFVSTLGVVFGIAEADETSSTLRASLERATWPDGRKLMTPLVGVSLMVFFVLACQCMSTLAVVKRESGSWKWPALLFTYMTCVAWVASFLVFQIGSALGLGGV